MRAMFKLRIIFDRQGVGIISDRLRGMRGASSRALKAIALVGEARMKRLAAPVGGKHLASIMARQINEMRWHIGATGESSKYSAYLNRGTNPSRGRFIWAIKKRFSKAYMAANPGADLGIHPGNKRVVGPAGLQFVEGTVLYLENNAQRIGSQVIQQYLNQG